jgi:hypothetical protein
VAVIPDGPTNIGRLSIPFCGDALREAKAATTAPVNEVPDDSLPKWRRRPVP